MMKNIIKLTVVTLAFWGGLFLGVMGLYELYGYASYFFPNTDWGFYSALPDLNIHLDDSINNNAVLKTIAYDVIGPKSDEIELEQISPLYKKLTMLTFVVSASCFVVAALVKSLG